MTELIISNICKWFESGVPIGLIPFMLNIRYGIRMSADEVFTILVDQKLMPYLGGMNMTEEKLKTKRAAKKEATE